ncbi:hypothetical protein [Sphingobium baderi]|uniref:Uncharacterized protein n=1 Tax=Sphingobium baderi LL03 TaxID=1114964 RepID=T0GN21_9SPHN|nr:hypothetical protein [Sphingobium baderi]EQB02082.1 hypothetical protein L485_08710 [Sphingobium baderi LL03]KMS54456.1 hypothetical protein V475_21405 [Sphingobium baderi LL03]
MTQLVIPAADAHFIGHAAEQAQTACIDFLVDTIDREKVTLRKLAEICGLHKSRLGCILHRESDKRTTPQLLEIHRILIALGISPIKVTVEVEASLCPEAEYRSLYGLLARFYVGLPESIKQAIREIQGLDGSTISEEWSDGLILDVTKTLTTAALKSQARRNPFL